MRWLLPLLVFAACDASDAANGAAPSSPDAQPDASARPLDAGTAVDAAPTHHASDALVRCAEKRRELSSIADTVVHLSTMTTPADGPCFIATLPRPLAIVATNGTISAQPAAGPNSPRLFFLLPKLVISAVPSGEGSKVLEFGEWTTATRTLKAEIPLPITAPLAADAPFRQVARTGGTVCAVCHRDEEPHPTIPNAYVSAAFKPALGTFVKLEELRKLHDACTATDDTSERCAMFHAVFDFGEVTAGAFAAAVETMNPQ